MAAPAYTDEKYDTTLAPTTSMAKPEPHDLEAVQTRDAVFGEISEAGPNYRNVRPLTPNSSQSN